MTEPKKLKKGDTVGLLATAGYVDINRIEPAAAFMEGLGLRVELGESVFSRYGFLAGTDELRAADINRMFMDVNIKGIFNMRGGYGSQRILPMLDYNAIRSNPKIFAGYSDTTALHIVFNQLCGFITYHSPMPSTELYKDDLDQYTKECFTKHIFYKSEEYTFKNPKDEAIVTIYPGVVEGEMTGGNLSLIASSIGTPYEIDTRDKIIFLEEIGEEPYRIDRMLLQLKYAGKFTDCAGIIFGAFSDCESKMPEKSFTYLQVIKEVIIPLKIPSVYNFICGHCLPTATIPMGAITRLDANKGEIIFLG